MRLPWDKDVVKLNKRGQKSITTNEYRFMKKKLQSLNKENSYIPEINFDGKHECYKQINIETWNFIKNNIILTTASMSK